MTANLELSDRLPSCSRCKGALMVSIVMPYNDTAGRPIHLELCSTCDSILPAACALLFWFTTGGGFDEARHREGSELMIAWTKEAMAEKGYIWDGLPPAGP